ncbi:MAG: hypothetical protein M1838_006013 [Thelocarpon superellum]|nr:MAG: hypothetical protein M1838_006013 [Thelocarpon superellum]
MASKVEELVDEPPTSINPYEILGLDKKASATEVKTAYRKAALKHHPDKASADRKDSAHQRFQEIAFAYAILSDEHRRSRYDTTGRTEESLDLEDDSFNWTEYYREQWQDVVSRSTLEEFSKEYKGSAEETADLLSSFTSNKGNMDSVFEEVMLSNPIEDESRFRELIDKAIAAGSVKAYPAYTKETKGQRTARARRAKKEEAEAIELAQMLGVHDKIFGTDNKDKDGSTKKRKRKGEENDEDALKALIQQRHKTTSANFLDSLEAKYGGGGMKDKRKGMAAKSQKGKKKGKKAIVEEDDEDDGEEVEMDEGPPESAFKEMDRRGGANRPSRTTTTTTTTKQNRAKAKSRSKQTAR